MITETVSVKKRRGRPPRYPETALKMMRSIHGSMTTRSMSNKLALQRAYVVLIDESKKLHPWLENNGRLRQGLLVELGRMLDDGFSADDVREWAELFCANKFSTRSAQRLIHDFRMGERLSRNGYEMPMGATP